MASTSTSTRRTAPQSVAGNSAPNHHHDFLARFTEREAQNRTAIRPQPLTVREHRAHREALKKVRFINRRYADETKINVAGILRKWRDYCDTHGMGDWREALEERLTREILLDFFLHVCEVSNIRSWGTSHEYIRQFQILYTNVRGQYLDRNDSKELYKYHETYLIPRFGYRAPNLDGKPVVSVAGLRVILVFNIAYDTGIFPLERHRLQIDNCYLFLCCTGCRPAELVDNQRKKPKDGSVEEIFDRKALPEVPRGEGGGENGEDDGEECEEEYEMTLDEKSRALQRLLVQETEGRGRPKALCYEDILLMMVVHPATGAHIPAMAIKFIHHKGADKKPRPTIFFFTLTKKLIFCAISRIIALALHDGAFDADSLTCASKVLETKVWGARQCIPLRWKKSKLKVPVLRKCSRAVLSDHEAMSYAKLRDDMRRQSLEAGFEKHWTPRFARRGAANAANGSAPDEVRDQMLRHDPRFATFYGAYINEIAQFHLQNAFLEEETEDLLFKMFAHVSLTRDPRATRDMVPPEVWANLQPDPEIVAWEERRASLKQGRSRIQGLEAEAEIRQLTAKIRAKTVQREKNVVKEYREFYFYNRPTWDIERQARGEEEEEYADPEVDLAIPERARLAEIWCNQPNDWSEEELAQHRVEAIDLMVALCDKRETVRRDRIRARPQIEPAIKQEEPEPEPEPFPLLLNPNQCPDCFGDMRLSHEERTFEFCRPTVRNDHFDDQHLDQREKAQSRGDPIRCEHPACTTEKFKHLDHFRVHVQTVHRVTLRSAAQVETRRRKKVEHRQMARTTKPQG